MTILEYAFKLAKRARPDRPLYDEVLRVLIDEALLESRGSVELASKSIGLDGEKLRREGRRVGVQDIPHKKRGCGKRGSLALVASMLLLAVWLPARAVTCDAGEGLDWSPVPDASMYVVFASTGGPWVSVAVLPALAPQIDPEQPPTPYTWAQPARHLELASGTVLMLAVGHDGTPVTPTPPSGVGACDWVAPCAMGFGGSDPREDMLACAGVPTALMEDGD